MSDATTRRTLLILPFLALAAPNAIAADAAAEQYVERNLRLVLDTLSDKALTVEARAARFRQLMQQFADVPRVSNFVLGRYSAQLRQDPALTRDWQAAFTDYAVAVYQDQLDQFRGQQMRITGSIDRTPGRDVIVRSEITPRGSTRPLPVQWRILKSGANWKIADVSLVLDGSEIWLAQQQQRDFLAALDGNKGDIRALIAIVKQQTATMRTRIANRR
jgi:phospholipid transport system substrate-binding protein